MPISIQGNPKSRLQTLVPRAWLTENGQQGSAHYRPPLQARLRISNLLIKLSDLRSQFSRYCRPRMWSKCIVSTQHLLPRGQTTTMSPNPIKTEFSETESSFRYRVARFRERYRFSLLSDKTELVQQRRELRD